MTPKLQGSLIKVSFQTLLKVTCSKYLSIQQTFTFTTPAHQDYRAPKMSTASNFGLNQMLGNSSLRRNLRSSPHPDCSIHPRP
mmetsp:Transcript_36119/g.77899  ORF Transcript_36119/g.77899 Transcript_36119/m.77899 type:complete len:83 (-) Transcript_36119:1868-2116(-)